MAASEGHLPSPTEARLHAVPRLTTISDSQRSQVLQGATAIGFFRFVVACTFDCNAAHRHPLALTLRMAGIREREQTIVDTITV